MYTYLQFTMKNDRIPKVFEYWKNCLSSQKRTPLMALSWILHQLLKPKLTDGVSYIINIIYIVYFVINFRNKIVLNIKQHMI